MEHCLYCLDFCKSLVFPSKNSSGKANTLSLQIYLEFVNGNFFLRPHYKFVGCSAFEVVEGSSTSIAGEFVYIYLLLPSKLAVELMFSLLNSSSFRERFTNIIESIFCKPSCSRVECSSKVVHHESIPKLSSCSDSPTSTCRVCVLSTSEHVEEPNSSWCKKVACLIRGLVLTEDAMNWMSTLGGGYSSLGEHSEHFAAAAGSISLHQLDLALRRGDELLSARCRLYWAQSLMQQGELHSAAVAIRREYAWARRYAASDHRLQRMCLGLWARLQHLWHCRSALKYYDAACNDHPVETQV